MWEAAGHQHGRALDYWLTAETEVLNALAATARALVEGGAEASPETSRPASGASPEDRAAGAPPGGPT